jgi:hypothetical protein
MSDINANDIYEQLGHLSGSVDSIELRLDEMSQALRSLACKEHQQRLGSIEHAVDGISTSLQTTCALHRERTAALEALSPKLTTRTATGESRPVTRADLENTSRMYIEQAESVAEGAVVRLMSQRELDAERRTEKSRKTIQWYLAVAATVIALLGGGSVWTGVKYMIAASSAMQDAALQASKNVKTEQRLIKQFQDGDQK